MSALKIIYTNVFIIGSIILAQDNTMGDENPVYDLNRKMSINMKDSDIRNVLGLIGELTGLNKDEMKKKYGEDKILKFRRSWDLPPGPLNKNNPYHPANIETYNDIPREKLPDTESLKDTYERVVKYYIENIKKNLNKNILVAAHGNSIRALCKYLFELDNIAISKLEIPTGNPLLITLDDNKIKKAKYLDASRAKDLLRF